jgi:hypothetical protein
MARANRRMTVQTRSPALPTTTADAAHAVAAGVPASAQTALALQAALLSAPRLADAAAAAVRELARRLAGDLAWLALADGLVLRLAAVSDGSDPAEPTPAQARLLAASGETFDQAASVQWPADTASTAVPRISLAHQALLAPGQSITSVPLVAAGRVIGVLGLRRADAPALTAAEVETLEHLACLAAPVLALLQAQALPWHRRAREALYQWLAAESAPWQRPLRRAAPVAAALLFALLLWPVGLPIGGHARLEGAVQRVLAAPADGFIQQVHVRPGERVRAGQPLLELADADLLLERQRWQSQLAQHLDGLAAAQARADRAQLVQLQSKADEAQAQLDLVDERLQRSRLVAPFDGIVLQGDLSQQLGAPVKLGAELMTLAPSDRFRVIVEVDERDVAHLRAGQTGSVALSALPWDTLPLRVARITPVATPREGRNVFEVEAELLEQPAGLRPGLQGSAQITAGDAPTLWRWSRRLVESLRLTWWEWVG